MRMPEPGIQMAPTRPFVNDPACREEDEIQTSPISDQITPFIQRQAEPEEEEEEEEEVPVQLKLVQRQEEEQEEEEEEPLQTARVGGPQPQVGPQLVTQIRSLKGGGQPLSSSARAFFESRFNYNFDAVRIHTNDSAATSAHAIRARAYTLGNNIVFGAGQYSPHTAAGKRLLAHELTHFIQQRKRRQDGKSTGQNSIQRSCAVPSYCPLEFCQPFPSPAAARRDRDGPPILNIPEVGEINLGLLQYFHGAFKTKAEAILFGISQKVNPRVVPLWRQHIYGGTSTQDLSGRFGSDFTNSPTTTDTTRLLLRVMEQILLRKPVALPRGKDQVDVNLIPRLNLALKAINTSKGKFEMNFNIPKDIAGNIAGGIGTNQLSCRKGARPSPHNDSRSATGSITVKRDSNGSTTLIPNFKYVVKDTIDLCPGDCGTEMEQIATVPLSRWEASGISGDIPFKVEFPAPAIPHAVPDRVLIAPKKPLVPKPATPSPSSVSDMILWFVVNSTRLRRDKKIDSAVHLTMTIEHARKHIKQLGNKALIVLHGYASKDGDPAYNMRLSRRRANRIRSLLIKAGIPAKHIQVKAHGVDMSLSPRNLNRRVEVEFTSVTPQP
jgi:hypothetical protein